MVKKSLFRGKKAYATVSPVLEIATQSLSQIDTVIIPLTKIEKLLTQELLFLQS